MCVRARTLPLDQTSGVRDGRGSAVAATHPFTSSSSHQLPKGLTKFVPSGVLPEDVWRGLGIRQSPGWEMYMRHEPVSVCGVGSGAVAVACGSQPTRTMPAGFDGSSWPRYTSARRCGSPPPPTFPIPRHANTRNHTSSSSAGQRTMTCGTPHSAPPDSSVRPSRRPPRRRPGVEAQRRRTRYPAHLQQSTTSTTNDLHDPRQRSAVSHDHPHFPTFISFYIFLGEEHNGEEHNAC